MLLPASAWAAKTHFEAAQEFYESGKETEARRALKQEIRARPGNLAARYNLAVLLAKIGHKDDALKLYKENMRLGMHLPTIVNLSAIYRQNGERKRAREMLKAASKRFRSEAVPWYLLAEMSVEDKDNQQAGMYFKKSVKADPLNGFAHIRYARFLDRLKRWTLAKKHAKRAVILLPECAMCWLTLGDIFRHTGDKEQALKAYHRSAVYAPTYSVRKKIITALEALGEHKRAIIMKRMLKRKP